MTDYPAGTTLPRMLRGCSRYCCPPRPRPSQIRSRPRRPPPLPFLDSPARSTGSIADRSSRLTPTPKRNVVSIKDPSPVFYDGRWHIYATYAKETGKTDGEWGMVYINFADWKDADKADAGLPGRVPPVRRVPLRPQVFYFAPQKLWYLVYQSQQPTYSTTTDISKPETWTKPQNFFEGTPEVGRRRLARLLGDLRRDARVPVLHRRQRPILPKPHGARRFPQGFDEPVVVMREKEARELFEGSSTYRIKGTNQYLTLIEAANENWTRYYKAFIADRLDGECRWPRSGATPSRN